jgi:hypothetical protein
VSIQDELKHVKEELSSDEKLLENAFRLERFYKKYRGIIWSVGVLALLGFGGNAAWQWYQQNKRDTANTAWLALQKDPNNAQALETLKSNNPDLYALYRFSQSVRHRDLKRLEAAANTSDPIIADLARYHAAVLDNRTVETTLYHDLSLIEAAWLDLKAGHQTQAHSKLSLVAETSPVAKIAQLLKHYTLKRPSKQ